MPRASRLILAAAALAIASFSAENAVAQTAAPTAPAGPTYADLADLADRATLVARVEIRDAVQLKPEQAGTLSPGVARLFVRARTQAVLVGPAQGESVSYLVDAPTDAKGKPPKFKKAQALIFARAVEARPGELRLVAPQAQIAWTAETEARVRAILTELVAPGAAPRVTGVREASYVPGNLVGEGETQIFLATQAGDPVSITVLHRPGQAPSWGVALGEIVDQAASAPARDTLAWYRLACFLPPSLPPGAILADDGEARRRASEDYRFVLAQLGPCPRTRGIPR